MPVRSLFGGSGDMKAMKKPNSMKRKRVEQQGSSAWPKVLFFAHHGEVLDGIEHGLRDRGVKLIRIDGSTTPAKR